MTTKPSEKSTEILFNHYLLQMFQPGEISLLAPSTVEEYINGYDTKIISANSFKEMYLQFKSPSYHSDITNKSTIKTSQGHQHRLLKSYPPRTTYYVFHTFKTIADLLDAQKNCNKPEDFLRNYIAVEVSQLPKDMTFMHYIEGIHKSDIVNPGYMRVVYDYIKPQCIRGDKLALLFKNCTIGTWFHLRDDDDIEFYIGDYNDQVWHVSLDKIKEICNDCIDGDFGTLFRIGFNNLRRTI